MTFPRFWRIVTVFVVVMRLHAAPSFTDLGFYNFWSSNLMPEQTVEAMVATSATTLYVASSYFDGGQKYFQVCKWSNGTWDIVPSTYLTTYGGDSPRVTALAVNGSYLYIGGHFDFIGNNTTTYLAQNIARVNLSNGTVVGSAGGLTLNGTPTVLRAVTWGGGSNGSRTYLYVASNATFSLNGTSCSLVGRTYQSGTNWVNDSMQGGCVSTISSSQLGIWGLDVNPWDTWDSTIGYRHKVYVSGSFNKAGGTSGVTATNIATWTESLVGGGTPWQGAASTSGRGVCWQDEGYDSGIGSCVSAASYLAGPVWSQAGSFSQAGSGWDVYYAGHFNKVNSTVFPIADPPNPCNYNAPINIARMSNGVGGLGLLNNKAMYSADGYESTHAKIGVSASGVFFACENGAMLVTAGTYPGSGTVAAGWHFNGSTWTAIGGTSSPPDYAPVAFLDVAVAGNAAFFLRYDQTGPVYKYVP